MKRRDFFKRLGTVSVVLTVPTLVIAAVVVKKPEPEVPQLLKVNSGHYTKVLVKDGHKYKMSYQCKIGPDLMEIDNVSVQQQVEDHVMKGIGVVKINGY